ncbi:hypothetical protein IW261DRAFT_1442348 [Armillaria novae-zelandiae]|uniref:MYND-type domain-containing protein n=1 Tax=Armillaria novae-zelandiae TaxID=153914 RepID=A0AA39UQW6_9AGAR|nr:hypothetical protein IW261DRAFT_1442348 [Armillaria novae-zelandiae]
MIPALQPSNKQLTLDEVQQLTSSVPRWKPSLYLEEMFTSRSRWEAFRDSAKVDVLCIKSQSQATMIEAIADIIRSVLAMRLANQFDTPENKKIRRKYVDCAEETINTLWENRKDVQSYHDEKVDEKSSPARLVIRRYLLFILTMALEENKMTFNSIVFKAVVFSQWLYLSGARSEERDCEQGLLKPDILLQVDVSDVYVRTVTQYYEDFGISTLCLRLDCFLVNANLDRHLSSFCAMLGACAQQKIPIPSKLYAEFVDKVLGHCIGTALGSAGSKSEATNAAIRVISLRLMDCTHSETSDFLLFMFSHSMLGHLLVTSPVAALSIPNRGECDAVLLFAKQTIQCCRLATAGLEIARTLLTRTEDFGQGVLAMTRAVYDESFLQSQNTVKANLEPVRSVVKDLALVLGLVDKHGEETQDPIAHLTQVQADFNVLEQNVIVCAYPTCPSHDNGTAATMKCSKCEARYCNRQCQINDWKEHKRMCKK